MCPSDRSLPALSIDSRKSISLFYSSLLSPSSFAFSPFFFLSLSPLFRCELSVSFFAVYSNGLLRSSLLNRINSMLFSVSPSPSLLFYFSSFPDWKTIEILRSVFKFRDKTCDKLRVWNENQREGKVRSETRLHAQFWNVAFRSSLEYGTRKRISLRGNNTKTFVLINRFTSNNEKYQKFCPFECNLKELRRKRDNRTSMRQESFIRRL